MALRSQRGEKGRPRCTSLSPWERHERYEYTQHLGVVFGFFTCFFWTFSCILQQGCLTLVLGSHSLFPSHLCSSSSPIVETRWAGTVGKQAGKSLDVQSFSSLWTNSWVLEFTLKQIISIYFLHLWSCAFWFWNKRLPNSQTGYYSQWYKLPDVRLKQTCQTRL